jgi:hypothetical protein
VRKSLFYFWKDLNPNLTSGARIRTVTTVTKLGTLNNYCIVSLAVAEYLCHLGRLLLHNTCWFILGWNMRTPKFACNLEQIFCFHKLFLLLIKSKIVLFIFRSTAWCWSVATCVPAPTVENRWQSVPSVASMSSGIPFAICVSSWLEKRVRGKCNYG